MNARNTSSWLLRETVLPGAADDNAPAMTVLDDAMGPEPHISISKPWASISTNARVNCATAV